MKIVIVQYSNSVIPFAIFYCNTVVQHDLMLEIIVNNNPIYIKDYSFYNIFESLDDVKLVSIMTEFKELLNKEFE